MRPGRRCVAAQLDVGRCQASQDRDPSDTERLGGLGGANVQTRRAPRDPHHVRARIGVDLTGIPASQELLPADSQVLASLFVQQLPTGLSVQLANLDLGVGFGRHRQLRIPGAKMTSTNPIKTLSGALDRANVRQWPDASHSKEI